jgi:hypothetical protein
MAKSNSTALLSKLKTSLPKQPPALLEPERTNTFTPLLSVRAPKLSVSLYHTDLNRLDEIKEFMRSHGHRNLSDSEALRLACRAVEINERFIEVFREMQAEDGRRARRKE